MRVDVKEFTKQDQSFVGFLTTLIADPQLGVIVTDIDEIAIISDHEYVARVHVRVQKLPEFERVEPEDYCRIHMTDEDFGFTVESIEITSRTN